MPTADSYERLKSRRPAPAAKPAPVPVSPARSGGHDIDTRPAPPVTYYGGGGGGDYGGGGGFGGGFAMPAAPPPPNKEEWIASDAGYKAQRDALAKALADYETNYNAEIGQYDVDYTKGIRQLGWDSTMLDDPMTPQNEGTGAWNLDDQTRSSGRAYQNQLNDYASRGLLQSSLYAKAVDDLMRSLDDQLSNMNTARMNFRNDKSRARTAYKTDNESQRNLAYADAASRYATLFGV